MPARSHNSSRADCAYTFRKASLGVLAGLRTLFQFSELAFYLALFRGDHKRHAPQRCPYRFCPKHLFLLPPMMRALVGAPAHLRLARSDVVGSG